MFWDKVARFYDFFEKAYNGKESGIARIIGKAGADFKRQFTFDSYRQFFAEAGYKDASYKMIDGRMPCAVAIITNP